jgi:hypothetical protein
VTGRVRQRRELIDLHRGWRGKLFPDPAAPACVGAIAGGSGTGRRQDYDLSQITQLGDPAPL